LVGLLTGGCVTAIVGYAMLPAPQTVTPIVQVDPASQALEKQLASTRASLTESEKQLALVRDSLTTRQKENDELKSRAVELEATATQREKEVEDLKSRIVELEATATQREKEVEDLKKTQTTAPAPQATLDKAEMWLNSGSAEQQAQLSGVLQPLVDAGNSEAMHLLGVAYFAGKGVKQDAPKGCKLLKQAKDLGNALAGDLYDNKLKCR
jgi:TPR repeat protein